jgi:outer membrane protein assembly factor BamB
MCHIGKKLALTFLAVFTVLSVGLMPGAAGAAQSVDWPQFKLSPGLTGYNRFETVLGTANVGQLAVRWQMLVAGPIQTDVGNSPVVAGGAVYVANMGGSTCFPGCASDTSFLYKLRASDGDVEWRDSLGTDQVFSTAAVGDGVVYVGAQNAIHAFATGDGAPVWTTGLGGQPSPALTLSRRVVYGGASDGKVYALSASDGKILWSTATGGSISSPVAAAGSQVYARSDDGYFYAFNATTGAIAWKIAQSADHGGATALGGRVYMVNGGLLQARHASNGALIWSVEQVGSDVHSTPTVGAGIVVLGAVNSPLVSAYDESSGRLLWAFEADGNGAEVLGSPVLANGVVYFITDDGTLHTLNAVTGAQLHSWTPSSSPSAATTTPAVVEGRVYVATADGYVVARALP